MPVYAATAAVVTVPPGQSFNIVNAEQLGLNVASIPVSVLGGRSIALQFVYASAPAAVQYDIEVSIDNVDAQFIKIGQTVLVAGDIVSVNLMAGGLAFRFVRVKERIQPGVNATVQVLG